MICYTTLDGFVIERVFRGNCATAETGDWFVSSNQQLANIAK